MSAAVSLVPGSPKVLVVDDAPANLIALGAVLKPLGLNVVEARSGRQALEILDREAFAVALLDVQMPGMDGFELAQHIRKHAHHAELPIIFLTAIHADELFVKRGYQTGAADYITKPFDAEILRARVKAFVDLFHQRERLRTKQLARLLESERAARREAEIANTAKDEFLATVSHELRTPLNAILGWSIIARDMTREPPVQRALQTIERNARSQMRIIEDVLDIGRIISGKLRLEMGDVALAEPLRGALDAVRPTAEAKEVTLQIDLPADLGRIWADDERVQQIVWNLLSNAIKFTPKGGHVTLRARREGRDVFIYVADDGQGIEPEFVPHVFEPFRQADGSTTRRHGGLGLGLAIVKQLVQAHGGNVSVESAGVGRGSTFTVQLPIKSTPLSLVKSSDHPMSNVTAPTLDGLRILVVDDDDDARDLVAHVLQSRGALVEVAASADDALSKLDEARPDIVLTDVAMPDVDGFGFIARLRQRTRIPAVAVTAHAKGTLTENLLAAGFQAHVTKPVDPTQLAFLVASITASR